MKCVWTSGFLHEAGFHVGDFGAVYTSSAGAPVAAYCLTGQAQVWDHIWVELLARGPFFDPMHLFQNRQIMDLEYMIEVFQEHVPLDVEALDESPTKIIVALTNYRTGLVSHVEMNASNAFTITRATCAFPHVSTPSLFNRQYWLDGGVADPLSVKKAIADGWKKVVVLSNEPPWSFNPTIGRGLSFLAYPWSRGARHAYRRMPRKFAEAWELIQNPPPGVEIRWAAPNYDLPVSMFDMNPDRLRHAGDLGMRAGRQLWADLLF